MTITYLQGVMGLLINTNDTANYFLSFTWTVAVRRTCVAQVVGGLLESFLADDRDQ